VELALEVFALGQRQDEVSSLSQKSTPLISDSKINQIHFYNPLPLPKYLIHNSEIHQIYFHPSTSSSQDMLSQTSTVNKSIPPSQELLQPSKTINEAGAGTGPVVVSETNENSAIEDPSDRCQITLTEQHAIGLASRMFN
ncbi:490_t:CDS:2, partial [Acaulospora morrowiae]